MADFPKINMTKRPSFFKVLIAKDFEFRLQIPRAFVKAFGAFLSKECLLKTYSKHYWKVAVVKDNDIAYFQEGWKVFMKDNLLVFGDFVVFECLGHSTFKVKMYGKNCCEKEVSMARDSNVETAAGEIQKEEIKTISPNKEKRKLVDRSTEKETGECKGCIKKQRMDPQGSSGAAVEQAKGFKSHYPSFHVTLNDTHVQRRLMHVPSEFSRKHMEKKEDNVRLQVSEKHWNVRLIDDAHRINYFTFSAGWATFVKDNKLKAGDICVFEMMKKNIVFQVHIFRC